MIQKKYSYENCIVTAEDCKEIKSFSVQSIIVNKQNETIDFIGNSTKIGLSFAGTDTGFATFDLWLADVKSKMAVCAMV